MKLDKIDRQLDHWAATAKEHDSRLRYLEHVRKSDPVQQAEDKRTDAWFKWYMANVNHK